MKKVLSIILAAVVVFAIPLSAHAESGKIDLSGLTYDELVELKDQINLAMWECDEWQEVEVPQGVWKVGEDIPEGKWTIRALKSGKTRAYVGDKTTDGGTDVDFKTFSHIYDEESKQYEEGKSVSEWTVELKSGDYVKIEAGTAVFTPYAGKPSLGFKK